MTVLEIANRIAVLQQLKLWHPDLPAVIVINREAFNDYIKNHKPGDIRS